MSDREHSDIMSWNEHVEGLIVGALRGRAEAHAAMERATGGALPSLNEMTMFEAAELLTATLLEASLACAEPRSMPKAFRKVGRDVLSYMKGLRANREPDGPPALLKIIEQAGLERHRSN
jgi:hypothetical protein